MRVEISFHNLTLLVEAGGELETLRDAQRWLDVPKRCLVCGLPTEIRYRSVTTKKGEREGEDFEYVDVQCTGYPKRHSSTLGQYKASNGGGFYYRENLDKFPWDEYDFKTKESRKIDHASEGKLKRVDVRDRTYPPDQAYDADPPDNTDRPEAGPLPNRAAPTQVAPTQVAPTPPTPTRDDLLQVYGALQDRDRTRSPMFLSFLAAYSEPSYSPEAARKVLRGLRVLSGPALLEPDNLRRILSKVGAWRDGTFTLDPGALRVWEARFTELS